MPTAYSSGIPDYAHLEIIRVAMRRRAGTIAQPIPHVSQKNTLKVWVDLRTMPLHQLEFILSS